MVDTKFRVFAENSQNVYSDNDYANSNSDTSSSRKFGNKSGTPVNSTLQNTALKMATMISKAVIDAIVNNKDLGLNSTVEELKEAILEGLKSIKVENSINADKLNNIDANSYVRLDTNNNFTVQPKYNNKKLLIETDTINNATNSTNATNATNATNYKDGSSNKNIANEFSSQKLKLTELENTSQNISMDIQDIQSRLNNLGFKEGSIVYRTSTTTAEQSNSIRKQGKFAICNLLIIGQGFTLDELRVPNEFKPKQNTNIYVRYLNSLGVYTTKSVTIDTYGSINDIFENVTSFQILNSGWEIA